MNYWAAEEKERSSMWLQRQGTNKNDLHSSSFKYLHRYWHELLHDGTQQFTFWENPLKLKKKPKKTTNNPPEIASVSKMPLHNYRHRFIHFECLEKSDPVKVCLIYTLWSSSGNGRAAGRQQHLGRQLIWVDCTFFTWLPVGRPKHDHLVSSFEPVSKYRSLQNDQT